MNTRELIAKVRDLPPASPAAIQLVGRLGQPNLSNSEVVDVLRCDMQLTAKLLHVCNSPMFAPKQPVLSVDQAVLLIGHQQIFRIVLSLSQRQAMIAPVPGYAVAANELWHHSLTTAVAAEIIVEFGLGPPIDPSVAFSVGLLHDIGKLVLGQVLTNELQTRIRELVASRNISRTEAELEVLGIDHAEAGALLLRQWQLPEAIIEGVANHHTPALTQGAALSGIAHVANCIAHVAGSAPGWDAYAARVDDSVVKAFGLSPNLIDAMIIAVRESSPHIDQLSAIS